MSFRELDPDELRKLNNPNTSEESGNSHNTEHTEQQQESPEHQEDEESKEASLQAKLQAYHKAIESEFKLSDPNSPKTDEHGNPVTGEPTTEQLLDATRKSLQKHMATAVSQIVNLAVCAESESVRLNASKFIIDGALHLEQVVGKDDPLEGLIKQLTKNTARKARGTK